MTSKKLSICSLCEEPTSDPVFDQDLFFCCSGCLAVYRILEAKGELATKKSHPLIATALSYGLLSNPDLLKDRQESAKGAPFEKLYLEISDLWCPACAEVIRLTLLTKKGVQRCIVDYTTDLAFIEYNPMQISEASIWETIESLGYTPGRIEDKGGNAAKKKLQHRFIFSAVFSLNVMMFSYALYSTYGTDAHGAAKSLAWFLLVLTLPVLIYGGAPIFRRCISSLLVGIVGMEALVSLGSAAGIAVSIIELARGGVHVYFDAVCVVITLVLFGKVLESKAKISTRDSLERLARFLPRKARVQSGRWVPLKEVECGDVCLTFTGEQIVLDGIVEEGEALLRESAVTGEAMPRSVQNGAAVISGAVVQSGWIAYRVTAEVKKSSLYKVAEMVETGLREKKIAAPVLDAVLRIFVPAVIALAICNGVAYFIFTKNMEQGLLAALSLLLISCPCAIGIAAPMAESFLLNALLFEGVLVRNRAALSYLGRETVIFFDKTGTLTEGGFRIKQLPKNRTVLKALAEKSRHPMAFAIAKAIDEESAPLQLIVEHPGKGMEGRASEKRFFLGSRSFLLSKGYAVNGCKISGMESALYFADEDEIHPIVLEDAPRREAGRLIEELRPTSSYLLSGDLKQTAEALAKTLKLDGWEGELHPLQKQQRVDEAKKLGNIVAFVGDGINDAPALCHAHVGISVVDAAEFSIQASDVLLTIDSLSAITKARQMAKKGRRVIRQNFFWAFFYNGIGIGLALAGLLTPIYSALAMVASSLIVIANSRRVVYAGQSFGAHPQKEKSDQSEIGKRGTDQALA